MLNATAGQILVNEALPPEYRDYHRTLDKKATYSLLQEIARKHPEKYREVSHRLLQIGGQAAQEEGGMSFGLRHLRTAKAAKETRRRIQQQLQKVLDNPKLNDKQKAEKITLLVGAEMEPQQKAILEEAIAANNPLARQVLSGTRGKPMNLASLLGSDLLYSDHRGEVIPIPVLRSYSEGLTPEEYWAGTYGARQGIIATKFATQEAGYLCLAGHTEVRMADGSIRQIREIAVGDTVMGASLSGEAFPVEVTAVFENGVKPVWDFRFRAIHDQDLWISIPATLEHQALLRMQEYDPQTEKYNVLRAKLPLGDCEQSMSRNYALLLACEAGERAPMARYVDREYIGTVETFDIEVDHPDHLFVLANGAVVSNSKQLNQAAHRLVVADLDGDGIDDTRGLVVDTDDPDNEGALLARDIGPYKRNTPLTPKILKHLKRLGKKRILVRSPVVGGSPEGGVYARDVGVREQGVLPGRGELVGLTAVQALSEPISQGQLSAKHSGGVAGQEKAVSGFQYIDQLIQVPKKMKGGAAHAEEDGHVGRIEEAPQGGHYVYVGEHKHYVAPGFKVTVKKGDRVEAGDLLSDGIPNPGIIVKHKGVGEGRRYFVNEFRKAMASGGMPNHRRNIELLARGLINHVKLTDEYGDHVPDDVIPYSTLEYTYKPRPGHTVAAPKQALGQYLERPVLHYTIGTRIRPSMLKDFEEFGIKEVVAHKEPPPFQPLMVRGMSQMQHDPDWLTQMYGSGLKKSLLTATARGATSKEQGSSFVPSLAKGLGFGQDPQAIVKKPEPGSPVEIPSPSLIPDKLEASVPMPKLPDIPQLKAADDKMRPVGGGSANLQRPSLPPQPPGLQLDNDLLTGQPQSTQPLQPPAQPLQPPARPLQPPAQPLQPPAQPLQPPARPLQPPAQPATQSAPSQPATQSAPSQPATLPPPPRRNRPWPQRRPQQFPGGLDFRQILPLLLMGGFNGGVGGLGLLPFLPQMFGGRRNLAGNAVSPGIRRMSSSRPAIGTPPVSPATSAVNPVQQAYDADPPPAVAPLPAPAPQPVQQPPVQQPPGIPEDEGVFESIGLPSTAEGWANAILDPNLAKLTTASWLEKLMTSPQARAAAAKYSKSLPWGSRLVRGTSSLFFPGSTMARGTTLLGGAAAGSSLPTLGGVLPAVGGVVLTNAAMNAADAAGLLPQWAGGTGVAWNPLPKGTKLPYANIDVGGTHDSWGEQVGSNLGWDQQSFSEKIDRQGPLSTAWDVFWNPGPAAYEIARESWRGTKQTADKVYDLVTGDSPQARHLRDEQQQTGKVLFNKLDEINAQKQQIRQEINSPTTSPARREQLEAQYNELNQRIREEEESVKALKDETEDWNLGKQNYFSGGHRYRDAMLTTDRHLQSRILSLEKVPNRSPQQELELENLKERQQEIRRLAELYSKEVGYFGEGEFRNVIRVRVRNAKERMLELQQQLRDPQVRADPRRRMQLEAEYARNKQRLEDYRHWARQAAEE